MKIIDDSGQEIEVYTADEVKAQLTAKEEEFGKTKAELEGEVKRVSTILSERADEFKQFRKLSDDAVAKLGVAERTIYDNQVALQEEREKNKTIEKQRNDERVESALKARTGGDEKLFAKAKDMWNVIGIDAITPEAIEAKTKMIFGAISATEPDLLASVAGFSGGSWNPPQEKSPEEKSYADTPQGQAAAAELGLKLEADKK